MSRKRDNISQNARLLSNLALEPSVLELMPDSDRLRVEYLCGTSANPRMVLELSASPRMQCGVSETLYVIAAIQRAFLSQWD